MEFLDLIESVRAEEATKAKLFGGEGRVRGSGEKYQRAFNEALKLVSDVMKGTKPSYRLQEAMTTSDFPLLFGDILDRQLLASYRAKPGVFRQYCKIATVPDFRDVKRFTVDGADNELAEVKQRAEYPEQKLSEASYSYSVKKYGRRIPFSWETMINDDLDALKDIPQRFGRAANRSEQRFATNLYMKADGPQTGVSAITGNAVLGVSGLTTAMKQIGNETDANGEPIAIDALHLVVPPALEITAYNIVNALQLELTETGGSSNSKLITANWIKNRLQVHVDPFIPVIATSNGDTAWFLFADPNGNRPGVEIGFLRGHEQPEIFMKQPNAERIGGAMNAMSGDFSTDSIEYKVRHVFGGKLIDGKMIWGSNGSGS